MNGRRGAWLLLAMMSVTAIAVTALAESANADQRVWLDCLPGDRIEYNLRNELVSAMGRTDKFAELSISTLGVLRVATDQVASVSDTTTCRRAGDAYSTAVGVPQAGRPVHVIRAGMRYVVVDPQFNPGHRIIGVTFDSSFTQVHRKFAL